MWTKEMTEELSNLFDEYCLLFGAFPDEYDEIEANAFEYDRFVYIIKMCIKTGKEVPYYV